MERKILHLDLDAFFCSVEELLDPSFSGKPFAVGGHTNGHGVIASASYMARKFGVRSAMSVGKALKLCPGLVFVHHHHGIYGEYSDRVMAIINNYSPLVQQVSVDEAFIDVSDMPQSGETVAIEMQAKVAKDVGLPCSIGVASNKLVAKIANDYGKSQVRTGTPPRAITVVPFGCEQEFLAPLEIQALWGVGPKTAQFLRDRGIKTIGQLAKIPLSEMETIFGKYSLEMKERAMGIDASPVHSDHDTKSLSNETTFSLYLTDITDMLCKLRQLSEKVGYRLRKAKLAGSVVQIKLRYSDFTTLTRQTILPEPTNLDDEIFIAAEKLLRNNLIHGREVRLIGVGVHNLSESNRQLSLWDRSAVRKDDLAKALDGLKDKYGKDIIVRASMVKPKSPGND